MSPGFEIEETTISEIHDAFRSGDLSCVELTQAYLDRIASLDQQGPSLNSYVTLNPKALDRAAALDAHFQATGSFVGALHGIPIGIKDQAETAGLQTSFGSAALKGNVPTEDATIVAQLFQAGAILLGKTTMPDFAASWWGYGSVHGITKCPYALDRDSSGSSGGTGCAVAANLCTVGVGEDTGGSIRLPASANNLVGIRPTVGMVSRAGMSPLLVPLDTAGPMARTVRDAATLLDVLVAAGYDPRDPYTASTKIAAHHKSYTEYLDADALKGARLGTFQQTYGDDADIGDCAQVNKVVRTAIETMKASGATVVELSYPNLKKTLKETSLYMSRSRNDVDTFLKSRPQLPFSSIKQIFDSGKYDKNLDLIPIMATIAPDKPEDDPEYFRKMALAAEFQRTLIGIMAEHNLDGICHPACQVLTPRHEELQSGKWTALGYPTNTIIASQAVLPSICVPAGFSEAGIPVGIEILAPPYHEPQLVSLGYAFEQETKWRRKPDFSDFE